MVVGLMLVLLAVAGVGIDGTRAFILRRSLQSSADGAALAAGAELDRSSFYASGGRRAVLDGAKARAVASSYLEARGLVASAEIVVEERGVLVILRGDLPTMFLGLVGVDGIPVAARARARPVAGRTLLLPRR